jgi:hypothetical protein
MLMKKGLPKRDGYEKRNSYYKRSDIPDNLRERGAIAGN